MAHSRRQFIDGDYGQIHLRIARPESPTRPPLVCLHMFPQSGRNFERFVVEASDERIVVAHDFPGYGESDLPPAPIRAEDYARSTWQVVDTLGLLEQFGTVDLFGFHAGSKLAVAAAHQRPDDVGRMILGSAAALKPEELAALRQAFKPIELDQQGTRFKRIWSQLNKHRGPGMTLQMAAAALAEILRSGDYYQWGHDAVFDYNEKFSAVIGGLNMPITILNLNDDLKEMTPRTLDLLKNGKLIDCPDWGHGFLDAFTNDVAQTINEVLT